MVVVPSVRLVALLAGAALSLPTPRFAIVAPGDMVTGTITLEARTSDTEVAFVKWTVGDSARTIGPPFALSLDLGPIPHERRINAIALDKHRRPLYEEETVLNRGGRGFDVAFVTPVSGQAAFGTTPVALHVETPVSDPVEDVRLEVDGAPVGVEADEKNREVYRAVVALSGGPAVLVARARTAGGREAERALLLNARGSRASSEVCVVQQMVGVYAGGAPVEGLTARDFSVRDDRGTCEIRSVEFVRDAPVAVGFAIDASISLAHSRPLLKAAADHFLDTCFRTGDLGFVSAFGPRVTTVEDWTTDRAALRAAFDGVPRWTVPGTELYEAVRQAVYRFQGGQGARALVLLTDGRDYEGSAPESAALDYARQSGVKIYAMALYGREPRGGGFVEERPDVRALERLTEATGGKTWVVRQPEHLPDVFRKFERDLRSQYLVSFVRRGRPENRFHPVTVRTRQGSVRTASGFFY